VRRGCAAFRVAAREVEEVDSGEDDKEAGDEGENVDCVIGIESAVEDEGGAKCRGCECYVVERIDTMQNQHCFLPQRQCTYIDVGN